MAKRASRPKAKVASKPKANTVATAVSVVPSIIEQVRREIGETWRQDDQLLDKFFPVDPMLHSRFLRARKELYNDNKRFKRWKGIPANPNPPSRLYTSLTNLMNRILFHYGISRDERLFLDTHIRRRTPSNSKDIQPGIYLAGVGDEFANTMEDLPRFLDVLGISAFEVSMDSEDSMEARDRLAVHMNQIFEYQDNRRFAFGVVITQNTFTVYMFDHSGVVASESCNYHNHPDRFCAVISGLAQENEQIGFDNTIFKDGPNAKIRTLEPRDNGLEGETVYTIRQALFHFDTLVGRGTLCWLTTGTDDHSLFVIKDAWIAPSELVGKESEGALLRHAQSRGVVSGVAQIRHFEEVRRSTNASDLDTVLRNRRAVDLPHEDKKVDRVHTRIVTATYGKTLDEFSTRMQLLLAFHDAVLAHRNLHDVAGILHRDISVRNILINSEGVEGNRGILIDFDHSIRVGDTSPYASKTKNGTWRYMSRVVLKELAPHSYLDDLESFYYVLCWILGSFESAGIHKAELPENLRSWDSPHSDASKQGQMMRHLRMPISPWFGKSLSDLANRLHDFFRFHQCRRQSLVDSPPIDRESDAHFLSLIRSPLDSAEDYDDFLALIRQAIFDLETEDRDADTEGSSSRGSEEPGSRKRKRRSSGEGAEVEPLWPTMPEEPPLGRPRRSTANYGLPTPVKRCRSQHLRSSYDKE